MVDFLVAAVQASCILGLLYGAYLSITYSAGAEPAKAPMRFDPVTSHSWVVEHEPVRHFHA